MSNLFKQFLDLIPDPALQTGTVVSISDEIATVELPGGGQIKARGTTAVGAKVFVKGGVIEGEAPDLPVELIEI